MISACYAQELEETLLWDWDIDQILCMPDSSGNRAIANSVSEIRADLAKIQNGVSALATKADLDTLSARVADVESDIRKNRPTILNRIWAERNFLVGALALLLTVLGGGIAAVFNLYLDHKLELHEAAVITRLDKLSDRVSRVEGRIQISEASVIVAALQGSPVAHIKEYRKELQFSKQRLAGVQQKELPGYWPTTFSIIRLASLALSPITEIDMRKASHIADNSGLVLNGGTYTLEGSIANSSFSNSIIVFEPSVKLTQVVFINCVFVFPQNDSNPTQQIRSIGQELLETADISHVTLNVG